MDDQTQEPSSPALEAMKQAMRAAEQASKARQEAKRAFGERQAPASDEIDMLANLAAADEPEDFLAALQPHVLEDDLDLDLLVAQASAEVPELENEERDGDLVVMKQGVSAQPWYQEAAEAALPEALKGVTGPMDVKTLLTALMVEIGDVKRTNALLLDLVTRVEEKVDRVNRQMKDRRPH